MHAQFHTGAHTNANASQFHTSQLHVGSLVRFKPEYCQYPAEADQNYVVMTSLENSEWFYVCSERDLLKENEGAEQELVRLQQVIDIERGF